jgi:hypothetical protein
MIGFSVLTDLIPTFVSFLVRVIYITEAQLLRSGTGVPPVITRKLRVPPWLNATRMRDNLKL